MWIEEVVVLALEAVACQLLFVIEVESEERKERVQRRAGRTWDGVASGSVCCGANT